MRLGPPSASGPAATDVAGAVRAAEQRLGHRPAVTILSTRGREEQGMASLAQWAAKGAHLLETDLLLEPGEALHLDSPLSWTSAAVCLAAWWSGVVVDLDAGGDVEVAVVHEQREPPTGVGEVLWLGDAIDGAPVAPVAGEPWVRAVQAFPDRPPQPRGGPDAFAARAGGSHFTQSRLLALAAELGDGTLGVEADQVDPLTGLVAVVLRPLVTGRPTVVLHGVGRDVARGERVTTWR